MSIPPHPQGHLALPGTVPLYSVYAKFIESVLPPAQLRLDDYTTAQLLALLEKGLVKGHNLGTNYPLTFSTKGSLRKDRAPCGVPATVLVTEPDGTRHWRYQIWGPYIMMGSEAYREHRKTLPASKRTPFWCPGGTSTAKALGVCNENFFPAQEQHIPSTLDFSQADPACERCMRHTVRKLN